MQSFEPALRLIKFSILGCFAAFPWQLRAEPFPELLTEALGNNPQLERDFHTFRAAAEMGDQAGSLPDPKLTYSEFLESVQTRTGPQERVFGISQAFPWPGTLRLRREAADAMARAAHHRYEATRRHVTTQVADTYFAHALVAESGRIATRQLHLLEELTPIVEERVRAGASMAASLRLEIELRRSADRVASFARKLPATGAALEAALGRSPGSKDIPPPSAHLPTRAPALPSADELRPGLAHHPMILAAESGTAAAEIGTSLAMLVSRPSFVLGANAIDIGDGGDSPVGVTLGLSLPIWAGKNRATREAAKEKLLASKASSEALRQSLCAAFEAAYQTHLDARSRVHLYDHDLLPPATEALDLCREDYRNGKAGIIDILDAERVLLDLQFARATALADSHRAFWKVRSLVGEVPGEKPTTVTRK